MKDLLRKYMARYTSFSEAEQEAILNELPIEPFKKGTVLIGQGEAAEKCYFILKGCVRQYSISEAGKEVTSNFYTEEQAVAVFHHRPSDPSSPYTFVCAEDSVMVVGYLDAERDMYAKYPQLESMTRKMIEANIGQVQEEFAGFIASSPEERFKALLRKRPSLIDRVPQHQLASYLGITPESLSRIKKRLLPEHP